MASDTNHLVWQLHTEPVGTAWRADGLCGVKYNILVDKAGTEGLICLPSGEVFIAAFEDPTKAALDDIKAYLEKDHFQRCLVRDATAKLLKLKVADLAKSEKRIILPGDRS